MTQPALTYPHSNQLERSELSAEIVQVPGSPETWAVEALDMERDGGIYATIFSGPEGRERAVEYASAKFSDYEVR